VLPTPAVAWSTASGAGSIDAVGQYTAPCALGTLPGAVVATLEGLSASASVTVKAGALDSLTLEPESATLVVTEQKQFAVRAADVCGNTLSPSLSWRVVDGGGSVDNAGLFTAGTVAGSHPQTLRVSAGNLMAASSITVLPGALASLSITPRSVELLPAGKHTFTARGEDRFGNGVGVSPTWSVMVGGGSISASGEFTAGSTAGTYTDTVRAEAGGLSAGATVIVRSGPASRIELKPTSATLAPRQQQRFTAQAYDVFGNPSPDSLTWSVASPQVGSIDSEGLFTAGTLAGVYREAVRVSTGNHTAVADITVVPGATARVELSPKDPTVKAGGTVQFTARVFDAHGNERPVQPRWTSSAVAGTIDATGLFTAGSTAGNYPSAVTATADGVSASTSVTIAVPVPGGGGTDPDPKPNPGGCGCSGTTDASAPFLGLMLLALVVTRRRSVRA
jgi:MYXO-CTERM domain-containing protein